MVVAAVVLRDDAPISGLNDSKKLTARRREALFEEIQAKAHVSVIYVSAERIDRLNIRGATLWGMREAVRGLPMAVETALIDGRDVPAGLTCKGRAIVSGDALSQSIAAASIIAKVSRDRLMCELHRLCPEYGFRNIWAMACRSIWRRSGASDHRSGTGGRSHRCARHSWREGPWRETEPEIAPA